MGYPYDKDWRDKITEDCVVVLDLDQSCFVSAAKGEERSIIARHKASGREKTFKNKREFYGTKKKAVSGWLADQNKNLEVKAKAVGKVFKPFTKEDFEIIDVQKPQPIENVLQIVKTKISYIFKHLDINEENALGVLGGENNFRLLLPAPEIYKGNREDLLRPLLLEKTREYVNKKYNTVVVDNLEADDYLSILAYKGWINYQKTGKFNTLVVSFDKDQKGTPGLLFDTNRIENNGKRDWKHPIPMIIDDSMGEIWMENNIVKGWGKKFLGYQMLCGDNSDNIKPYQTFKLPERFGDTAAFKLIGHLQTEYEMWSAIVNQYKYWFPNGVEFTSWDGSYKKMTAGQWASIIFQMVYMKRTKNDKTTLTTELKRVGVI